MPRPDVLLVRGHDMYSAGTCPADMYLFALKKYISCERVPFRAEKVHMCVDERGVVKARSLRKRSARQRTY